MAVEGMERMAVPKGCLISWIQTKFRPAFMKRLIFPLMLCLAMHRSLASDASPPINPDLLRKAWPASWIAHPTASPYDYGIFHFRKSFNLEEKPASFVVHLSADNRYRFFVNGTSVCF